MSLKNINTIKVNFKGGIISPGVLYNILVAANKYGVLYVRFGLRQQLLFDVAIENLKKLAAELDMLEITYEVNSDSQPNIISSYPAEEVFIVNTWLSEGIYKDIFDSFDYTPKLKINISDSDQSFTPLFTGNINWVAAPNAQQYWHLFIRFPKTNIVYEWKDIVYTNDIGKMSKHIEEIIFEQEGKFYDTTSANGDELYSLINKTTYNAKPAEIKLDLPPFKLPYYEGLNRYNNNKYWLGIYRRDELFSIAFLKQASLLCLETRVGQLCSTPWKSIIIKGIEEKNRKDWNELLDQYQVNVRHAANELNFQVEDNCTVGLNLKQELVQYLNKDDTRTFGVCIGIKTRRKSEVFSSILVRKKPLIRIGKWGFLNVYDILCAKDYNPNQRTGFSYSVNNPKFLLPEQLRRAVLSFYNYGKKERTIEEIAADVSSISVAPVAVPEEWVYQCNSCKTIYSEDAGDAENGIEPGTLFANLPIDYICATCEAPKAEFEKIDRRKLGGL
jgi:rubredoxin